MIVNRTCVCFSSIVLITRLRSIKNARHKAFCKISQDENFTNFYRILTNQKDKTS